MTAAVDYLKLRLHLVALVLIGLLQVGDIITTRLLVSRYGPAAELNPLRSWLLTGHNMEIGKFVLVGLLLYILRRKAQTPALLAMTWFGAGFYFLTVTSNALLLTRAL